MSIYHEICSKEKEGTAEGQTLIREKFFLKTQNSNKECDVKELERLKKELDEIEHKEEIEAAREMMAKYKLEGEKPTCFFC